MAKRFNYSVCSTISEDNHSTRFCVHGTVYEEFAHTTKCSSISDNDRIHGAFRAIKDTFSLEDAEKVLLNDFTFNVKSNNIHANGNITINLNSTDFVSLDVHEKLRMTIGEFSALKGSEIGSMIIQALQARARVLLDKLAKDELSDEVEW